MFNFPQCYLKTAKIQLTMTIIASKTIQNYFQNLKANTVELHSLANEAKKTGIDPQLKSDIPLAASVAERVEAIMGSISPNLIGSGISERISELEKQYGFGDWRVALVLADEIAKQKFCKFEEKIEGINIGIRTGFAYITQGTVSAPLEGLINVKFKKRKDGENYLAMYYAGPIRGGGATASAVTTVIADYVRIKQNIARYDPTPQEIKRYHTEIVDYYDRVERKQYKPTEKEIEFIISNLSVELNGDPTSELTVSNHKGLPRVETDRIRGGMALMLTDCVPLKGAKVWKKLKEWGTDFGLEKWVWLEEFLELKSKIHAHKKEDSNEDSKLKPNYAYISEIVAGRPVFTHPLRQGGFRLRYGRSRLTGHGSWAISPITMRVLSDYLAVGTQLRVERPGKSTSLTSCDSIEGPILKLKDGSVVTPKTEDEAKEYAPDIHKILFLGDILISPGEFIENGHMLVPAGYCPEWWLLELSEKIKEKDTFIQQYNLPNSFFQQFLPTDLPTKTLISISKDNDIPLHPKLIFFWKELSVDQIKELRHWISSGNKTPTHVELTNVASKKYLEIIGCNHEVNNEKIQISISDFEKLNLNLNFEKTELSNSNKTFTFLTELSGFEIRDKNGTAIGARMGRPEKAKMRDLKGSPNFLFPVGNEGGRLRNFRDVITKGYVTSELPIIFCNGCEKQTIFKKCEHCDSLNTKQQVICNLSKRKMDEPPEHGKYKNYEYRKYDKSNLFKKLNSKWSGELPSLIKGVRSTMNKFRYVEHPFKGLIRAKYGLRVNKDGTIRYDGTELGTTHFIPKEIGLSIEKARELGYISDKDGNELTNENQIIEIFPQDIIIPDAEQLGPESATNVLMNTAHFVDEELTTLYDKPAFYNIATKSDLIGQLVIGLAPHTSAGIIGRIIGFSKVSALFAHPYWHAAQRRDLDGEETSIMLTLEAFLNFSRDFLPDQRGTRSMDAPLVLSTILNSKEVDDEVYDLNINWKLPLELYRGALEFKNPWDIKLKSIKDTIDSEAQYENHGWTHPVSNMNKGVLVSAYKSLPTMNEKLGGQMELAEKIRAVDKEKVAELVINGHFIRDTKGNLRKFTMQRFRCVKCNEKYRRMPLSGTCSTCHSNRIIYTISEGSIKKYLSKTLDLIEVEGVSPYVYDTIKLLEKRIDSVFGREATKQIGLGDFMNG